MKKKNILLALSGLLFFFAGCSDDEIVQQPSAVAGQEVQFGAATTSVKTSRTSYTGQIKGGFEGVHWESGDKVRLFCAQSANTKFADYSVQTIQNNPDCSTTTLLKIGAAGLQWANAEKYTFYGVYPSPAQYLHRGVESEEVLQNNDQLMGYIPKNQFPLSITKKENTYVCAPNMNYAYMVAKTETTAKNQAVDLTFTPFVTTLTISVKNATKKNASLTLNGISISSRGNDGKYLPVYGKFKADLSSLSSTQKYPKVDKIIEPNVEPTSVYISLVNQNKEALTLKPNEIVEFTVFLLPDSDLHNIELTLHAGATVKRGLISGVDIIRYKKNFVRNVPIEPASWTGSNWITYLPDKALVNQLSIPGAGGVGGHLLTEDLSREQTLNVTQLWNQGVRAFEFSIDRPNDGSTSYADFFNKKLICNGNETSLTFKDVLTEILDPLSRNRGEFAMVIINYQPIQGRDANKFMEALNICWKQVDTKLATWNNSDSEQIKLGTKLYDPATTTVGESRGKLFCIARPTSQGEETELKVNSANVHPDILVINGWGSLKDKWIERGYTEKQESGAGLASDGKKLRHPFIYTSRNPQTFTVDITKLQADFTYDVQPGNSFVKRGAWVQEWPRVSKGVEVKVNSQFGYRAESAYWANTFDEKKQRISETFERTMYQTSVGQYVFINSLCGYFVDKNIQSSYSPYTGTDGVGKPNGGMTGNVKDYATEINNYVYGTIFQHGLDDVSGPLGIVLMDRVGNDQSRYPANTNLPYLIISNNFRFDMTTKSVDGSGHEDVDVRSARSSGRYDFIFDASANK